MSACKTLIVTTIRPEEDLSLSATKTAKNTYFSLSQYEVFSYTIEAQGVDMKMCGNEGLCKLLGFVEELTLFG